MKTRIILATLCALWSGAAAAQTLTTLHEFNGKDGYAPLDGVILDEEGNLYGATAGGGKICDCGVVFEIAKDGLYRMLYTLAGSQDVRHHHDHADLLRAGVARDAKGNLYTTAFEGGDDGKCAQEGCGIVLKVSPRGRGRSLHDFLGAAEDGGNPWAGPAIDAAGNLYGTAFNFGPGGAGIVFGIAPDGTYTILHAFGGIPDGAMPRAALLRDAAGNLYGTTYSGGRHCDEIHDGCGTVFKLAPDGTTTILFAFPGGRLGAGPLSSLSMDDAGNLYGTTSVATGGNFGIAYRIAPDGTEAVLHEFAGGADGEDPESGLLLHPDGNLYGTTAGGGDGDCMCGTIYRLTPEGGKTTLYRFHRSRGAHPMGDLVAGPGGAIYGTASDGGHCKDQVGCGTVFRLDLNAAASRSNRRRAPPPSSPRSRPRS